MIITILLLLLLACAQSRPTDSLRRQWGRTAGSTRIPDRVILVRACGDGPDLTQPIGGFSCSSDLENVALACLDTHKGYLCHAQVWTLVGSK